jgi:MoaA/NifB/PqqE/SkfB family radical SAM enzyme
MEPNKLHVLKFVNSTKKHGVSHLTVEEQQSGLNNNLCELSVKGLKVDKETPRCNRARLDTGPFCNYDCEFCYYRDILDIKASWETVKQRIDYLHKYGITEIDCSGGESSVSPDWFKILDYCTEKGFKSISCLSHGGKFSNMEFLQESVNRGLKEILFSLHGATEETHDKITGRKGSFVRILKGIENAQKLNLIVRTNATIYYQNYHQLKDEYAKLINRIKPVETNFITLNYWGEFHNFNFKNVSYKDMTDGIKSCIDQLQDGIRINVRYVPFCYMKGYEKYVCDHFQHIYDLPDWNKEMYNYIIDVEKEYNEDQKLKFAYDEAERQRKLFYKKETKCLTCKHFYICDGIEKELYKKTELFPEPGEKIREVNHYRHDRDKR